MEAESKIHPLAIVHENAKIGKNVEIGPFAVIGENVEIGDGTRIEPHAVITGWTKIGKDCVIFPGASIGAEPQDLKFVGENLMYILVIEQKFVNMLQFIELVELKKKLVLAMIAY